MGLVLGKRRRVIVGAAIACLAAVLLLAAWSLRDPVHSSARRKWKDQAIAQIEQRVADKQWLAAEARRQTIAAATRPEGAWAGDEMIVARNGDWIVCRSICGKENARIKDIFIGRGSDGKWYYSTFHFCAGKCVLQIERQPDSLAQFVDGYWLAPFDGRSDDCLETTWTGIGPWGEGKLQSASRSGATSR